ncbi:MAG: hypothetical protein OEX13_13730 [Gammaproteobacteria bacterium]|nr:hypothetical protein [Gammaproteobacteria bacterium]
MAKTSSIFDRLIVFLTPLRLAGEHEGYLRDLAAAVGWDLDEVVGFDAAAAAADLRIISEGIERITQHVTNPPETLSAFVAALEQTRRTFEAVRNLDRILRGADSTHLDDFAKALLEALVIAHWFQLSPTSFVIAELLGLVVAPADGPLLPAIRDGEKLIREEHRRGELRFHRIGPLLRDPVRALEQEYFSNDALATVAGAHRAADTLFPRLARLCQFLGISARYGFNPAVPVTGEAAAIDRLAHMLSLYVSPHDGDLYGMTLALSSADRGRRGLLVRPFGAISFQGRVNDWRLQTTTNGSLRGVLVGPDHVETSGGETWHLSLTAEPETEMQAAQSTVGGSSGTGFTFGTMRIAGELHLGMTARDASFELFVKQAHLGISGSDGDGFLANVLPAQSLSTDVDFTIGWSSGTGVHFGGHAGLEARWPLKQSIGSVALGALRLGIAAGDEGLTARAMFDPGLTIGPVTIQIEGIGLSAHLGFTESGGNLGVADLALGFQPPTGLGLALATAGVTGGGFLGFDPQRAEYSGMLQLELADTIAVKALGLLTTRLPDGSRGYSLVILLTAEGFAPIPIGLGFTLTGIGGLVALHRTVRTDVLREGLKTGTLNSILFPSDPLRNAPQIFSDLRRVFPPTAGRHVVGPMVQLRWGSPTLLTLDLALLVELPSPIRVVVLGRLQVLLPDQTHPLIQIRMDALGVLDVSAETVALDATLYDSRILQFTLTGDMALRAGWGRQPQFILAIGGFHPRFAPPPGLPALQRLALQLADGDSLQLRCQAYLAVTSNTVQFGARVDLHAAGGGFSFDGMLGFDAIIQLAPLAFEVDVGAALALRYHGRLLVGVSFKGRLAGPTPWQVAGKASIKLLFFSVSVSFSRTFGSKTAPPLPAAVDVVGVITAALADRRNWSGAVPRSSAPVVTIRETAPPTNGLRVHPWAELTLRERIAPLNRRLTKLGTAPLVGGPTTVTVTLTDRAGAQPWRTTPVQEPFALAQFEDLREDEQLAQPAFVPLQGGLTVAADDLAVDDELGLAAPIAYETVLIDPTRPPERPKPGYVLSAVVLARVAPFGAAGQAPARKRRRTTALTT